MYLDGSPSLLSPPATYILFTIESVFTEPNKGTHGNAEWALVAFSSTSVDPTANCQLLASFLLCHNFCSTDSAWKAHSLKIQSKKKKKKNCVSSEFCLLNPIINSTNIYWAPNMHQPSRTSRKLQFNRNLHRLQELHPRDRKFSLRICSSIAPTIAPAKIGIGGQAGKSCSRFLTERHYWG